MISEAAFSQSTIDYLPKFILSDTLDLNPGTLELTLTSDAPLFGFNKHEKVLVSSILRPKNGNLVIRSLNGLNEVFRYETARGEDTLWPGNKELSGIEKSNLYVIVYEGNVNIPRVDVIKLLQ